MLRDARGGHNRKSVNENFFKVWSPNMAYVLGFIFADGSLIDSNSSSRTYYLSFFNNDLDLLKQIKIAMESGHQIYVKPPHMMDYKKRRYLSKTGYVLRIGNRNMYYDLINLGLEHRKSNIMTLPDIPVEYFLFFVRGYFDGDGCISWHTSKGRNYPSLRVLFTSGSKDFLSNLNTRLSNLANLSLGHIQRTDSAYNLVFQAASAIILLRFFYSNLEQAPFLKYKHDKYIEFITNLMGPRVKKSLGIV